MVTVENVLIAAHNVQQTKIFYDPGLKKMSVFPAIKHKHCFFRACLGASLHIKGVNFLENKCIYFLK